MFRNQFIRPFSRVAQIQAKAYSMPLQRVIVDFAADESFEKASRKIKEHYGMYVPASSIRKVSLVHAQQME